MKSFIRNLVSARIRSLVCAAVLATAGFGFGGGSVQASDCTPTYRYEWVQRYETREVPYTVCETRYDHCGRPCQVEVTRYRTERYAVWYRVAVRVS
jgi:hypothetical protein